jgi:two-component system, LytTR family, sensor kinase
MKPIRLSITHPSINKWLFTYKLYHLPFWFAYHYSFWVLATGSVQSLFSSPYLFKFSFYVIFQAIGVYFNLYFLIPRLLEKGRYGQYLLSLVLTVLCTAIFIIPGYHLSAWSAEKTFQEAFQTESTDLFYFFKTYTLPSTLASTTLAMSIKLTKNWIRSKTKQQELEKEKLETELKFLKSQMNPHFLFNTINSIFVLIHKNPAKASESLAKFSDLLRYQLYECNDQQIPLNQELRYLENFIELQGLRQDHNRVDLKLNLDPYATGDLTIAPFVLIPFIENAFKHVSQRDDQSNWIRMNLHFERQQLHFSIVNSISATHRSSTEVIRHRGIGLKNVQRRLDLLYPEKHTFVIRQNDEQFEVQLQMTLQEIKVPERMAVSI